MGWALDTSPLPAEVPPRSYRGIGAQQGEDRILMLEEKGLEGGREHDGAYEAMKKAKKVIDLLEEAFELIVDDDPAQPATKYVHAALFEAERRAHILEEGYRRTYR